ncbi:4'-phosphopantetheinyl transferase superfamily protein [Synechococcus sp. MU1643]|nr:4'-phosphopantetheinyl transferase superfamily protein [Synechococcus sp. MU1643]
MLVAHLPQPPTRAEQRAMSDSLTCRLFADAGQVVASDDIGRTIYGKPQLRDSPLHHSVSNTRSLSLGVVGPDPIGIDVEALDRPLRVASELLKRRMFASAADATACLQHWTLIQAWTAKEAVLKAAGLGLGGGLPNVTIAPDGAAAWLHGSRYSLSLWTQEGFSVAVAEGIRG